MLPFVPLIAEAKADPCSSPLLLFPFQVRLRSCFKLYVDVYMFLPILLFMRFSRRGAFNKVLINL